MRKMLKSINKVITVGFTIVFFSCCTAKGVRATIEKTVRIDTTFHPNGKIREIYATIDSVKQGLFIGYDTSGKKDIVTTYVDGECYGPYIAYNTNTGNVMIKAFYKNEVWDGEFISYYEDGGIQKRISYRKGIYHGLLFRYREDGKLSQKILYDNDTIKTIFFDDGSYPPPPIEK